MLVYNLTIDKTTHKRNNLKILVDMNVDGGVGNVEMIGKHILSIYIFWDLLFKHQISLNSILWICDHYQLKFAEIITEKTRAGFRFATKALCKLQRCYHFAEYNRFSANKSLLVEY